MLIYGWDSNGVKVTHEVQEDIVQVPAPDGYGIIYEDGKASMVVKGNNKNDRL